MQWPKCCTVNVAGFHMMSLIEVTRLLFPHQHFAACIHIAQRVGKRKDSRICSCQVAGQYPQQSLFTVIDLTRKVQIRYSDFQLLTQTHRCRTFSHGVTRYFCDFGLSPIAVLLQR